MADEKYILTLEGSEIDEALLRLANYEDEGLVLGSRKGVMLGPGSEYYHKNARYYAELAQSAVPGDTTSAVRWDIDQSALTDADREMARKNIRAGGSNRSLLDNGWFLVNQRGLTTMSAASYAMDRWKCDNAVTNGMVYSDGVVTLASNTVFAQRIEPTLMEFLKGKTVTASLLKADGTVVSATNVVNSSGSTAFPYVGGIDLSPIRFRIVGGVAIKAVKLELGSVSTLANDALPDYGEELRKCMRYFVRLKGDPVGVGYVGSVLTTAYIHLFTPIMRAVTPTITYNGAFYIRGLGFSGSITAISAGSPASNAGGVSIRCTMSSSPSQVQACAMYCNSASDYIDISADL